MQVKTPVTTANGGFTYHELPLQDAGATDQEQAKKVCMLFSLLKLIKTSSLISGVPHNYSNFEAIK